MTTTWTDRADFALRMFCFRTDTSEHYAHDRVRSFKLYNWIEARKVRATAVGD